METVRPGGAADDRRIKACRLSRRSADLLMVAHASRERIAALPMQDLIAWRDGLVLALRRERNKSMARHWAYDLNRHIALKLARDRVAAELSARAVDPAPEKVKPRTSRGFDRDNGKIR